VEELLQATFSFGLKPRIHLVPKQEDEILDGNSARIGSNQLAHSTERRFLHFFILKVLEGCTPVKLKK